MHVWTLKQVQIPGSDKCISDFHCLQNGPHWSETLSIYSLFFTVVISMAIESQKHYASSTHVQYVHQLVLKYLFCHLLHLLSNFLYYPNLSLAMKWLLISNEIWSLRSEVTWALEDWRIYPGCTSAQWFTYKNAAVAVPVVFFWNA